MWFKSTESKNIHKLNPGSTNWKSSWNLNLHKKEQQQIYEEILVPRLWNCTTEQLQWHTGEIYSFPTAILGYNLSEAQPFINGLKIAATKWLHKFLRFRLLQQPAAPRLSHTHSSK